MAQYLRLLTFLAGLMISLSWEVVAPHHASTASKPRRWVVNLSLAVINGIVLSLLCTGSYLIAERQLAPWRFGVLELAQPETDSNYGTLLVAWERLFASLRTHTDQAPPFGLLGWRDLRRLGLLGLLVQPFLLRRR